MKNNKESENGYDLLVDVICEMEKLSEPEMEIEQNDLLQFCFEREELLNYLEESLQWLEKWSKKPTETNIRAFKLWFKNQYSQHALGYSDEIFEYTWGDDKIGAVIFEMTKIQLKNEYDYYVMGGNRMYADEVSNFIYAVADAPFIKRKFGNKSNAQLPNKNSDFSYLDFIKGYDPMEEVILYLENQYEPTFLEY
jgi:hypothetical protein